ncbi:MAG: thermostable hemolysin [Rhodocyclaceae bacterium]|nr:thermostable hemolysin [Rhodocyclaceae bacterium]
MSAAQTPFRITPNAPSALPTSNLAFPPFGQALAGPGLASPDAVLCECLPGGREPVRQLIRDRFHEAYGARIASYMPRLLGLHRAGGSGPLGAVGLREAKRQALFVERYLDQPIEAAIGTCIGRAVPRSEIVEVGQFAGSSAGAFRSLILRLIDQLHAEGHRWVVFTGTTALRNAFSRLGLSPVELASADPARLAPAERDAWGSYYHHDPRVMFGDIREGHAVMSARLATGD